MEEDKPEGWGLDKKVEAKTGEEFESYKHNLSKALKKLEITDKIDAHKKKAKDKEAAKEEESNTKEILEATNIDGDENMDERFQKLMEHKKKLIESRAAGREDDLRSTFTKMFKEEKKATSVLEEQKLAQKNVL